MTMMVRGRVQRGRLIVDEPVSLPDELEVALAVIIDDKDDLDEQDRSRLHEDLRESAAQIERGEVYPIEQVLAEI